MFTIAAYPPPASSPPALVQRFSSSSTRNNGAAFTTPFQYVAQYAAHATTAGNALVVAVAFSNNVTLTVADTANTYTQLGSTLVDSTDGIRIALFGVTNCAAGARVLTVTFSGDPGNFVAIVGSEHANVTGFGSPASNPTTGTTASVPLVANGNDRVWMFTRVAANVESSFAAGAGGTLLGADLYDGHAFLTGASSMTLGTSGAAFSAGVVLQSGVAGSVPSGIRIIGALHQNVPMAVAGGGTGSASPNPATFQFPALGNHLFLQISGGIGGVPGTSGVTDNKGNTWTRAIERDSPADESSAIFDSLSATLGNDLTLTCTFGTTNTDITVIAYDVVGLTGNRDQTAAANGNTAALSVSPFGAITPAHANSLVFANIAVDFNTMQTLESGADTHCNSYTGQSQSGPCPTDENNGWYTRVTTTTSSFTPTFTGIYAINIGQWSATLAVYF